MARQIRIDLRKLGERLPEGVKRAGRTAAKVGEKPLAVADALTSPEHLLDPLDPLIDKAANPVVAGRLGRCTIETRAHVLAIADLPALEYEHTLSISIVLIRLRVERPGGEAETCVRQHLPVEVRRLAPGSSVRALAHDEDPRFAVIDWKATAERLGTQLSWPGTLDQYAWPEAEEWPAAGAIEVRDSWRHRRRLEKQRADWTPVVARLLAADMRGGRVDGRERSNLELDVGGTRVTVKERIPDLALARLIGLGPGDERLGGLITTHTTVVAEGAPLAALVSPGGEVAVDWEATLNQPDFTAG